MALHLEMRFFKEAERFVIAPTLSTQKDPKPLVIDRRTGTIGLESVDLSKYDMGTGTPAGGVAGAVAAANAPDKLLIQGERIFGVFGIIRLLAGPYLMIVRQRLLVGVLEGNPVYKIGDVGMYSYAPDDSSLSDNQKKQENTYLRILKQLVRNKDFYFSYSFDLTNTLTRKAAQTDADKKRPLFQRVDNRFFWNRHILEPIVSKELHEWILPVMRGIVQIFVVIVQKKTFDFILISRRSRFRAGTRYKTRGVDNNGQVANYVETEQIVCVDRHWLSFVQTRGSIPLVWEQSGIKYTPIPKINPDAALNKQLFALHFEEQLRIYQRQLIVNLLDQKGVELELCQAYENYIRDLNNANIIIDSFDFHDRCKTSYDNVSELITKLMPELDKISFFHMNSQGLVVAQQYGCVRTNCLDCLDRTNLVQSFFGRAALMSKLKLFGINYNDKENSILERVFKEAWANNGDAISLQYAGTGALKSDFTRTGQRETKGVIKDGVNSLSRYYINTFRDTLRQVSIDLFLGNYNISATHEDEDAMISQSGLWNEQQYKAIEACSEFMEEEVLENDELISNAWIIVSINKYNVEQERIFIASSRAVYRFKYNFNAAKNPIVRFKRIAFSELKRIEKGWISEKKKQYAFVLFSSSSKKNEESDHIYAALDFSKEAVDLILDVIDKAVKQSGEKHPEFSIKETTITRTQTFTSGIINKLGGGFYNKRKQPKGDGGARATTTGSNTGTQPPK